MYLIGLLDRIDARQFLDRLQGSDESRIIPPVVGYLLFLTGELDRHIAEILFDSLEGLHEATGPYVAGFIFFKSLNIFGKEQHRVNGYEKRQEYEFKITKMDIFRRWSDFERYAEERRLVGDYIANALGITEHLPCIVGLDAVKRPRMNSIHVTKFPEKAETLTQFVRGIISDITDSKSRFQDFASGLETLERLENQYSKCSEAVKIRDRIKGILRGKISISKGSIREQLAKVVRSEVILSDAVLGALESLRVKTFPKRGFMNQMLQLSHLMNVELDPTWLNDKSNIPTGNRYQQLYQAKFLERAIEIFSRSMVTQRELDNLRIQMEEKGAEVSNFRQQLLEKETPSLVKIVARNAKQNKLASLGEATLSAITDSISEVIKPSFILKLSSLIR